MSFNTTDCRAEFERQFPEPDQQWVEGYGYANERRQSAYYYWQAAWNRRASGWRKLDQDAKEFAEVIVGHYDADNDEWRDVCRAFWHTQELEWMNCDTGMGLIYKPTHYMPINPPTPENAK